MKKPASLITYVAALVIGVILLSLHEKVDLLKGIVITMGILITIPSALMLISAFTAKNENGERVFPAWYTILVTCAGLVLGIWMLCMPDTFKEWMVYTLGVGLILVGAAQMIFIHTASKPLGPNPWWYCVPVLVLVGGFIICFIGPDGTNVWATLTTGVLLIVYAANGIASFGRECKVRKEVKAEEKNLVSHYDENS